MLRAPGAAWLEDQVVSAILRIESTPTTVPIPTGQALESLVYDAELETGLTLTDEQHAAVALLLTLPVAALQGGAGVGKTTVMKVLATARERGNLGLGANRIGKTQGLTLGLHSPGIVTLPQRTQGHQSC